MDARKPVGATRKISRKDGRYLEDTNSHPSKSSRPRKSIKEKTSRSPLRVTTLESNVKTSCHVGFREPLASYRDAASVLSSSNEKSSVHPVSGLNNGGQDEKDFDSTRTSALDETSVRYLNDRLAIDALEWRSQQSRSDIQTGFREMKASEISQQHVSFSPSSNKLETLKRRQPDTKLEKLKERIRQQWEMSVEKDNRERLPNTTNYTDVATGTKTRKVAAAPPPPSYRGFNPPETKIRTPDGKVWQEAEFQNLSAQLHSTLTPSFQEIAPSSEKTKERRTSRPVRKVQRLGVDGGSASPDGKMGHIISTSSWRDGQKLVKQILGPARKVEKEAKSHSDDLQTNKQASSTSRAMDKRSASKERSTERRMVSDDQQGKGRSKSSDRHTGKRSSSKDPPKESQDTTSKSASWSKPLCKDCLEEIVAKDSAGMFKGLLDSMRDEMVTTFQSFRSALQTPSWCSNKNWSWLYCTWRVWVGLVNREESQLVPAQRVKFLGYWINTEDMTIALPGDKVSLLIEESLRQKLQNTAPVQSVMRMVGLMTSTIPAVTWAQFHSRPLQNWLLRVWGSRLEDLDKGVQITEEIKHLLLWWMDCRNLSVGRLWCQPTPLVVTTDASAWGWSAHCQEHIWQAAWEQAGRLKSSNWRELKAIELALCQFREMLAGHHVAVAYINRQGGTRSHGLMQLATNILTWAEHNLLSLTARHIKGSLNELADSLSRTELHRSEWTLNAGTFAWITSLWGCPEVDLFAAADNRKVEPFFFFPLQERRSPRGGRFGAPLEVQSRLRISSTAVNPECASKAQGRTDDVNSHSAMLAEAAVVHDPPGAVCGGASAFSASGGFIDEGHGETPAGASFKFSCMATEREVLTNKGLSARVVATLLHSRKPITSAINLKVSVLSNFVDIRLAEEPLTKRFMRAVGRMKPPKRKVVPNWDLSVVLQGFLKQPFGPLGGCSIQQLTIKTALLVALVSARRISEIQAFSITDPYCTNLVDRIILRPDPAFLPKVVSTFHRTQEVVIPSFATNPASAREREWQGIDVRRNLPGQHIPTLAHSSSRLESHHPENSTRGQAKKTNEVNGTEMQKVKAESTEVKKDFLPLEIRGILEDLQLDGAVDGTKQVRNRSQSPTKRKPEKGQVSEEPHISSKRRHYDTEQVRLYIMRQQEERKKSQQKQREAQRQAEEQKNKRLQELYQKQKETFSKAKSVSLGQREKEVQETTSSKSPEPNLQRPHDTYTKLLLGQAWPEVSTQKKETKLLYQPSGESDKENKGQERPHSASSSSDLSLSEPLQPLLRNDLAETYYPQPDRLTSKSLLPHSYSQTPGGAGILPQYLALPKDLESMFSNWKSSTNVLPSSHKSNVQGKPSTDFKSNLDRIESLKATAVSLSSRIENEAKKLAGGSLNFPSAWSVDPDPRQPIKAAWKKPDSPPERESREDVFSSRMQKMLSTCSSSFSQDDLPGANHLYRKHPEELMPRASTSLRTHDVGQEEKSSMQKPETSARPEMSKKASLSPNSSTSSISEGPILSEASFSEEEGLPKHESHPNPAETLKSKEFCIRDTKSFAPLSEFQREADKYLPLPTSSIRPDPWEELAKGSPHSVINIFTRSYQYYGKKLNGHCEESKPEPVHSAASPQNSISYADDFVSSQSSEATVGSQKSAHRSVDSSASSAKEELSAAKSRSEGASSHSSPPSSVASSPLSVSSHRGSSKRKESQNGSPQLPLDVVQNVSGSEHKSNVGKQAQSGKEQSAGSESDSTMGDLSSRSITSLMSDGGRNDKSHYSSIKDTAGQAPSAPAHPVTAAAGSQAPGLMAVSGQSAIRFSPAGLQHRMSAELNYLGAMEESVRQLCDVERVRGISLAQQETVSLAQILKSQQQRHEQSMAALRLQAEQEAQASMRQLEEARQMAAQTQAEMLQRFQKTLEASASQNVVQVQEAVDHDYLSPTSSDPAAISSTEQQKRHRSRGIRKKTSRSASPSSQPSSSVSSFKEQSHSSSEQESPPPSSVKEEIISQRDLEESISEELPTPDGSALKGDSSISLDDKGVTSAVPTNEEGIEELSFRSLLPSESHRRGSLERQRSRRHESDEESTPDKELSGPFSSGQDSFWKFTMEMVRQYMQEGEMRSAHQAALLRLRQKALKEKTKAELAWLEHQRRSLRDKGEDDKMPPLKKRQRGLLLRLQQEQAEIKRLQEANKAARRERQLILKQQEEIQRIQDSTLRLQEKLKSAESGQLPSEGDVRLSPPSSQVPSDAESRSPSPVSVSGSETSSIMQKLRKMHSHMDAKFLTKREQQLVQRRLHAQELLEWKRRLDAEELEIRRIEKQALAAWEKPRVKTKSQSTEGEETVQEEKRSREASPTPMSPAIHTRTSLSPPPEYLSSESIEPSPIAEQIHEQSGEHSSISEDLVLSALSKKSPPRSNKSQTELESSKESTKSGRQNVHITLRPHQLSHTWSEESLSMTYSEATSDQSDIEGRIRALKEELRKRKSVVENLKREQKRRQKERLRAQEAILLQQLQSYDEYIQKTQDELSREQATTPPSVKSVTKADQDLFSVRPDYLQRADITPSFKAESEHITDISTRSEAESSKQEKSLDSRNEVVTESIPDEPVLVPQHFTGKEDVSVASSLLLPAREALPNSAHDSPVSSIHSEIPEDVLDTQSQRSISPLPTLNLNLRSETPEDDISPQKDHSYSEDFESSVPLKLSASETPREEFDVSLTTPGRELHSDSFFEKEEDNVELKSASPHILDFSEVKPPSLEHLPISNITDPLAMLQLGDRVLVSGVQPGTLRFKGETLFAEGIWAGVELDKSEGNNDGSLGGSRYFVCSPLHGIFAPPYKISQLVEEEFVSPSAGKYILSEDTAFVNRDYLDGHLPLIEDFEQKTPEKTPSQSAESSVFELHTTSIQEELQVDIITDTALLDKEPQDFLLEPTEKLHEDNSYKRAPEVGTISDSLLQACLKDTVAYLQNIRNQRAQKIQQSNQEFHTVRVSEEIPKQDQHQRLGPFHDTFTEQKVEEFDPSHSILSVLREDADWFEEDFGLSSHKKQRLERAPSAGTVTEPSMLVPRSEAPLKPTLPISPPELTMAVPHSALEAEQLVQSAVDELWGWKRLSLDIAEIRNNFTRCENEEQSPAHRAYKEMLFDLTLDIFEEICSPDPRGSQPPWKKPVRVTPSYSRRVRDPNNIQEVKSFLTSEVLNLLSLKKEQNHKMDWQRMMKFGRKKRDRVDHILVQELHEEEAQWVNYDEDELFVKMQLADGIFEALIRDTIQVLQRIQSKKNHSPTV
ncbi:PREDICTED: centrosome-associated protein 350 [Nanorana parkeri]|uniref:centrosome-associated protein 350 n=1 Tax=Nanorana parkeri TaxID=125878 RepID=UPI00085430E1|nr:PREDICTED: centrosome-associated protein 350 [Nanorana parkeri]